MDIMHSKAIPTQYPLVFVPGSPIIEKVAVDALHTYLKLGGTVVLSEPWPEKNEFGRSILFLGHEQPSEVKLVHEIVIGAGKLVWHPAWIAQEEAEQESLESLAWIRGLFGEYEIVPHVYIQNMETIRWVDWSDQGGCGEFIQPRNLGSAILHTHPSESILFVLNHYPEAVRFSLELRDKDYKKLEN